MYVLKGNGIIVKATIILINDKIFSSEMVCFLFYTPTKGNYIGVTLSVCAHLFIWILSGSYLLNYKSCHLETAYTVRTQYWDVQHWRIITLLTFIFQLLPFVNFHFEFLSRPLLNYDNCQLETSNTDRTLCWEVQCTRTITLLLYFLTNFHYF